MPLDAIMLLDAAIPHDLPVRAAILIAALGLDALFGDPPWLWGRIPHPVVLFGRVIAVLDRMFNRPRLAGIGLTGKARRGLGVVSIFLLVGVAIGIGSGMAVTASGGGIPLSVTVELLLVAILLAGRSLANHARAVVSALENGTIEQARSAVSKIVSRNPNVLDRSGIAKAAIETTAENLSDGVVAPALYYLAFGLPGIFAYKIINTADSMVGFRTAEHFAFGWSAAWFDDFANFVPARLTGLLIAFAKPEKTWQAIQVMLRDAPHHCSPNAGWPEAAMAVQIDRSLAGPRHYGGRISEDREINIGASRETTPEDIIYSVKIMWRAVVLFSMLVSITTLA